MRSVNSLQACNRIQAFEIADKVPVIVMFNYFERFLQHGLRLGLFPVARRRATTNPLYNRYWFVETRTMAQNTFKITMKGDRLTVELNGIIVIENALLPGIAEKGPIGLQHHGDKKNGDWVSPPSLVQFRNIYIKEL